MAKGSSDLTFLFFFPAEHVLSGLHDFVIAHDCHPETNLYEAFMYHSFPWIFDHIKYNYFTGFVTQVSIFVIGIS